MRRTPAEPFGTRAVFAVAGAIVRPVMNAVISRRWVNLKSVPAGAVVVSNHMSEIDPLVVAHALYSNGHYPRFLAKASLFKIPVAGKVLTGTGQVPVDRGGAGAGASLEAGRTLLDRGGIIVVYPEGTLTRDPELWPMKGHTGAARLALKTGAPVVPVVHWGDQELLPRYGKSIKLFPRKRTTVKAGAAVDLDDLRGKPLTKGLLAEATERIMRAITAELQQLRGGTPPEQLWDPAAHGQASTGRNIDKKTVSREEPHGDGASTGTEE
ncbi:MAG: 1-acyl-sn-glycerol-3-phosphate acyltransferase [Arthrobacter sp.]|jgi:1-acyl-sn-glycerol-3-phosphate acyltransferase|nr:1-acyl-sn-glycerol-3-phosphate acyltransferase [Arthrobacter sp.]